MNGLRSAGSGLARLLDQTICTPCPLELLIRALLHLAAWRGTQQGYRDVEIDSRSRTSGRAGSLAAGIRRELLV